MEILIAFQDNYPQPTQILSTVSTTMEAFASHLHVVKIK